MTAANNPPDRTRGFWRWVKNPWIRRRAEREAADEEAGLAAFDADWVKDADVARLVAGLRRRWLMWPVTQKFERLGRRAEPHLIRALADSRYLRPYPENPSRLPLREVLRLLDENPPAEIAGRLAELASHKSPLVREAAARSLGSMATPATLPAWLAATRDPDGDVRSAAVWGVDAALRAGRVTPEFAVGAFDRVAELLDYDGPGADIALGAAGVLVRLDPACALPQLLDPRRFAAGNPRLHDLLKAADEHGLPLPPDHASRLMDDLRPHAGDYFAGSSIGYLLCQLARQRTTDARARADAATGWAAHASPGAREIGQAAARALALLGGVTHPTTVVLTRLEAGGGIDRLTAPQRAYYVAWACNAEVENGGFAQYFVNTAGGSAWEAAAAFEAIGATAHAPIVRRAVALFGPAGPAADRDARHEQLAALTPAQDAELVQLDAEYYGAADDVPTRLLLFAGRHPGDFQTGEPSGP